MTNIPPLTNVTGNSEDFLYLPLGIHPCTLTEIETVYTYNVFRKEIFQGLLLLVSDLKSVGCNCIYVDGSFVSSKLKPKDVDVCWESTSDSDYLYEKVTLPALFHRQTAKNKYKADVFPYDDIAQVKPTMTYINFFQTVKFTSFKKGILKVDIYA